MCFHVNCSLIHVRVIDYGMMLCFAYSLRFIVLVSLISELRVQSAVCLARVQTVECCMLPFMLPLLRDKS